MTARPPPELSPLGTAHERLREQQGAPPSHGGPLVSSLQRGASRTGVPAELGLLAWELARLGGGSAGEMRALEWLVLASLLSMHQGSTRLPVEGPEAEGRLRTLLEAAGASASEAGATLRLTRRLAEAQGHTTGVPVDGLAPELIGPPGSAVPLWYAEGALCHHRLGTLETRLCQTLARHTGLAVVAPEEAASAERALDVVAGAARGSRGRRPAGALERPFELAAQQRAAVAAAASYPLVLISGGPGTGKTSIVVTMLRLLLLLGTPPGAIALAAPTGKAAHRLEESVRKSLHAIRQMTMHDLILLRALPAPTTLHRLLGYTPSGERFRHHENNRLAHQVVIVDEASMVDLALMEQLVRSLRPGARLVLLGDADQLPSVEPGAVFRDFLADAAPLFERHLPGKVAAVRLDHSYRMDPRDPEGRAILGVAQLLREGRAPRAIPVDAAAEEPPAVPLGAMILRRTPAELTFSGVEWLRAARPEERTAFLDLWYERHVAALPDREHLVGQTYRFDAHGIEPAQSADLERLFRHAESSRLLCLTHRESPTTGAAGINAHLHLRALATVEGRGERQVGPAPELVAGEPVLMRQNDYTRHLFNGDQGLVVRVAYPGQKHGRNMVVFPRAGSTGPVAPASASAGPPPVGFVAFPLETLRGEITLCYANTVHAAQGSEFQHVALVLPERELPLLTRELLYTAVTRARRSVTLIGALELLEKGARHRLERHSGLASLLGAALAGAALAGAAPTGSD